VADLIVVGSMRKVLIIAVIAVAVLVLLPPFMVGVVYPQFGPITVPMRGSVSMFEGGVVTPMTDSQDFIAIIALTPMEHRDADKLAHLLRAGCFVVSLRITEEPDQPAIMVSDMTKKGEVIVRCKTIEEANHVIDRLHAGPGQKKT
jgi:hypothetical protein